jgi:hypothetical protein
MKPLKMAFTSTALAMCLSLTACVAHTEETQQGWTTDERESMYFGTQGSRLIPRAWLDALELADGTSFADIDHLTSFGLLPPPPGAPSRYPIGMAIDQQDDRSLSFSKLRWYQGQGNRDNTAEPWVGLNCTSCHTGGYINNGKLTIVDGAPGMFDYQSFINALDVAMSGTLSDSDRWDRFVTKVLAGKTSPENEALLQAAFTSLLA